MPEPQTTKCAEFLSDADIRRMTGMTDLDLRRERAINALKKLNHNKEIADGLACLLESVRN